MCDIQIVHGSDTLPLAHDVSKYVSYYLNKPISFQHFTEINKNIKSKYIFVIQPAQNDYQITESDKIFNIIKEYTDKSIYWITTMNPVNQYQYLLLKKYIFKAYNINLFSIDGSDSDNEKEINIYDPKELENKYALSMLLKYYDKINVYSTVILDEKLLTEPKINVIMLDEIVGNWIIEIVKGV